MSKMLSKCYFKDLLSNTLKRISKIDSMYRYSKGDIRSEGKMRWIIVLKTTLDLNGRCGSLCQEYKSNFNRKKKVYFRVSEINLLSISFGIPIHTITMDG